MSDDTVPESVTDCFISYKREDNTDLGGVVDRIRADIGGLYAAHTGKSLRIFVDRESIGWGEDWREKIRVSVERATVLIPVITMRYFTSQNCREELMSFYNNAEQLGVTELILPIVLMGEDQIRADDAREEVRLIERLNYKPLRAAWLAGFDSAEWRQMMFRCVEELDAALQSAETTLVRRDVTASARLRHGAPGTTLTVAEEGLEAEEFGDMADLQARFERLSGLVEGAVRTLNEFGEVAAQALGRTDFANLPSTQVNAVLVGASSKIKAPSEALQKDGAKLLREVQEVDAELRAFIEELRAINIPQIQRQLGELLDTFNDDAGQLAEAAAMVNQLVEMLKFVSLMNVALRKALRPGIQGIQSISSALDTLRSWERLPRGAAEPRPVT